VKSIPNFDPTTLPFWDVYVNEERDATIRVGGKMAGTYTPGLSGGQRKLLLFELIYQRTMQQSGLLIVLDEPFAGVTDDFVPFIVERLNTMRKKQNILLVTNDHGKSYCVSVLAFL
jgi:ABC-type Mn2+/Zn2+ transport system ATPase subunit